MSRDREREAWGDAVYEAWRRGGDPDRVDRDCLRDAYEQHGDWHLAAEAEADRVCETPCSESQEETQLPEMPQAAGGAS